MQDNSPQNHNPIYNMVRALITTIEDHNDMFNVHKNERVLPHSVPFAEYEVTSSHTLTPPHTAWLVLHQTIEAELYSMDGKTGMWYL